LLLLVVVVAATCRRHAGPSRAAAVAAAAAVARVVVVVAVVPASGDDGNVLSSRLRVCGACNWQVLPCMCVSGLVCEHSVAAECVFEGAGACSVGARGCQVLGFLCPEHQLCGKGAVGYMRRCLYRSVQLLHSTRVCKRRACNAVTPHPRGHRRDTRVRTTGSYHV
jgi:hypothetical protein